jgi:uncharacterized protein
MGTSMICGQRLVKAISLLWAAGVLAAEPDTATPAHEPTVKQVYQAAENGHLDQAHEMIARVLKAHPESAKAHFVAAEINARQQNYGLARDELKEAEKLAPGLPFAKPDAVSKLKRELARGTNR